MATAAAKKKAPVTPECPYGARCYRKNPQHFVEFSHPKKMKTDDDETDGTNASDSKPGPSLAKAATVDDNNLPPCKYGAKCYRKNLLHFAEFSHPTNTAAKADDDSGNDTDVMSDEDDTSSKPSIKDVKTSDIIKRGMSLVKSYSAMSEEERKELVKKAFEAKKQLEEELQKTKDEVKKKEQEVEKLQKEVATGLLLMDGEKEALEGDTTKYFDLFAERAYKEGSAAQTHFRLAESQFYRLLVGQSNYQITKVQYVVNPTLTAEFKECREGLKKLRGEEFSYPVLAFHGTKEEFITPICEQGFKVPGQSGHKHRTDTGWYGKGVYFSEYPSYSMGYIQGSSKLLLCQVLPGKVFNCTKLIHGASLKTGYDSHTSPDKKELVIFNKFHILPAYIVHYTNKLSGEFKYTKIKSIKDDTKKGKGKKASKDVTTNPDDMFDMEMVNDKYYKAAMKKATKVFAKESIQCSGTFCCSQRELLELCQKHGGSPATKAVFSLLVASENEYNLQTNKVLTAKKKMVPIVPEVFIYDCILSGKFLSVEDYDLESLS